MTGTTNRRGALLFCMVAVFAAVGCKKPAGDAAAPDTGSQALGKPQLEAVAAEFDFGVVKQGAKVEHVFKLRNSGDQDLVIKKTTGS